jgi:hypothetical protein
VTGDTLHEVIRQNVNKQARIMTDNWSGYSGLKHEGWNHQFVNHSMYEYVRGDVTTNGARNNQASKSTACKP